MLLGVLVLAVVLTIVIAGVASTNEEGRVENVNVSISPYLPVLNATIYKDYYGDESEITKKAFVYLPPKYDETKYCL